MHRRRENIHRRRYNHGPSLSSLMSDINITPFVDVVLVLLIVFMIGAPLLLNGVSIDLPKTGAPSISVQKNPVTVSINTKGQLRLEDKYYASEQQLLDALHKKFPDKKQQENQQIFVQGARSLSYQKILGLLALLQKAGFSHISLMSLPQRVEKAL